MDEIECVVGDADRTLKRISPSRDPCTFAGMMRGITRVTVYVGITGFSLLCWWAIGKGVSDILAATF